jgi:hypothetical protein
VVWGVVGSYPLSSQAPTPVEVELGCDNKDKHFKSNPPAPKKIDNGINFINCKQYNQQSMVLVPFQVTLSAERGKS